MSTVQCPICALRFRFQSELEAHAHDDHCAPQEVRLPPPYDQPPAKEKGSRLLRLP